MKTTLYALTFAWFFTCTAFAQINSSLAEGNTNTLAAILKSNSVNISWQPQAGSQTAIIEKSDNGKDFYYVAAFATTQQQTLYYQDNNFYTGENYYRIKTYLSNNTVAYSNIASINTNLSKPAITLLPAQLGEKLYLWIPSGISIAHAAITDASGRAVKKCQPSTAINNISSIATMGLPAGVYQLCVATGNGQTLKLKFTKAS